MCEPTITAKKRWQREAETEMALLAMEEVAANNGLTEAGGGEACVACVHLALWCLRIFWVKIKQDGKR